MKTSIYCKPTNNDTHSFYLLEKGQEYFLFSQVFRRSVDDYYGNGVSLEKAINHSSAHRDRALNRTMSKILPYVQFLEKEEEINVLSKTKKKHSSEHCKMRCA